MEKYKWVFPSNNDGEIQGISDSGMETFLGNPLSSLAREICQNSLDAKLVEDKAVTVEFNVFELESTEIPDGEKLRGIFKESLYFWNEQNDPKSKNFYTKGMTIIEESKIKCLRVSDFNTTGLSGVNKRINTPWINLTKSNGVSDKTGSAGGSFGIGKFAPFACSNLRTVFYNTINTENETAFQGVSRLSSFFLDEQVFDISSGIGFYGREKNRPILENRSLDKSYSRKNNETGTDIFILGFRDLESDDWRIDILKSVLDSYLLAIINGKLEVIIGDVLVNTETVDNIILDSTYEINQEITNLYHVLKSDKTIWDESDFMKMGPIKIGVLKDDNFRNNVVRIRKNGMKIYERAVNTSFMKYTAAVIIEGEKINAFLRSIENPQHNKWDPERYDSPSQAKAILRNLNSKIREVLESFNTITEKDIIEPIVGGYLSFVDDSVENENHAESLMDTTKDIEVRKVQVYKNQARNKDNTNLEAGVDKESGDTNINEPEAPNTGINGKAGNEGTKDTGEPKEREHVGTKRRIKAVGIQDLRIISVNKESGEYFIKFLPKEKINNGIIDIKLIAETHSYPAIVEDAYGDSSRYIVEKSKIIGVSLEKNVETRIYVTIDHDEYCPMEVKLYENY